MSNTVAGGAHTAGGGIYGYLATPIVESSTITGNSAANGAAGGGVAALPIGLVGSLHNSVVQGNAAAVGKDLAGSFLANHDLIGTTAGAALQNPSNNIIGADPKLGPLAANGGPTMTRAILPGSPLLNAGDPTDFQTSDQRGEQRPGGAAPDIGAYELIDTEVTNPNVTAKGTQKQKGKKVKVVVKAGAGEAVALAADGRVTGVKGKIALPQVTATAAANAQTKLTLKPSKKGAKKITKALKKGKKPTATVAVTLTDSFANSDTEDVTVKLKAAKKKQGKKG